VVAEIGFAIMNAGMVEDCTVICGDGLEGDVSYGLPYD